ncbi:kinase-associated lipoprotein B [Guptibacillus hwajinpoensis]|uniref:Kinase n=2 Tax=Guptibacillus hwajinpoensis TaxID=208199 RepID=A0A0J6D2J8_9BACL|nr:MULTISPECIES: kinase-associated lipoprotein B [Alkalihalobacillus]KMM38519.1 kinase [Alkalihalobacillus macyae]MDP4551379.1 kinase-associated lipoprotein B [Alkalihalobacillus macyae]MDQ0483041.1 kinase-associated protein B [Alkalihalobacillus hemicentroti]
MSEHKSFQPGEIVTAGYKTGRYIGEIVDLKSPKAVVKILAVMKHPTQGDLHNPKELDVPLFHQRKALAEFEKALVPMSAINHYEGEVPDYKASLQEALDTQSAELKHEGGRWAEASLTEIEKLKDDYFPKS